MKLFAIISVFLLIVGCGGSNNSAGSESGSQANVVLKGDIRATLISNPKHRYAIGTLMLLGEVVNNGDEIACFINITIESFDASGSIIGRDSTALFDHLDAVVPDCINPDEFAPFLIFTDRIDSFPVSFSETITFSTDTGTRETVPASDVVFVGGTKEKIEETFDGEFQFKKFSRTIKNNNPDFSISPQIIFAAFKNGVLVDAGSGRSESDCREFGSRVSFPCIRPFQSSIISVFMNLPPEDIDEFYFRMSYSAIDCICQPAKPRQ